MLLQESKPQFKPDFIEAMDNPISIYFYLLPLQLESGKGIPAHMSRSLITHGLIVESANYRSLRTHEITIKGLWFMCLFEKYYNNNKCQMYGHIFQTITDGKAYYLSQIVRPK